MLIPVSKLVLIGYGSDRNRIDWHIYVYTDECIWIFKTMYTHKILGEASYIIYYIVKIEIAWSKRCNLLVSFSGICHQSLVQKNDEFWPFLNTFGGKLEGDGIHDISTVFTFESFLAHKEFSEIQTQFQFLNILLKNFTNLQSTYKKYVYA